MCADSCEHDFSSIIVIDGVDQDYLAAMTTLHDDVFHPAIATDCYDLIRAS